MNIELNDLIKLLQNKKDLTINQAYAIFLEHISNSKRIDTLRFHNTYYKALLPFYDIENIQWCSQLNNSVMIKLIAYERSKKNSNNTINKKITHIKYMLNYLYKIDLINKHNITIDKLSDDTKRYDIIKNDDLKTIIESLPKLNIKYQLQILLLMTTGLRRTELYKIKLNDIHKEQLYINLSHTKNGKQRNIYIDKSLIPLINQVSQNNKLYLFENQEHTNHESADNIYNVFDTLYQVSGVYARPHMLRHTYATKLLEKGNDLETIRLLLGHSDYSMIMRYVHIKNKRLAEISTSLYDLELPTDSTSPLVQNKI